MAELINKNLLMDELHSMLEGDADLRKDYEYMGIDDCIRSMPTTTEEEIRARAIDEFAEAVKAEILPMLYTEEEYAVAENALDDIEKEMKGE